MNFFDLSKYAEAATRAISKIQCEECHNRGWTLIPGDVGNRIVSCHKCGPERARINYTHFSLKSKGRAVDRELLVELNKAQKIDECYAMASKARQSCLMIGATGRGKTVSIYRAYNDTLEEYGGSPHPKVWVLKEYHLWERFRDEDSARKVLDALEIEQPAYVFIDELFREKDWRDANSDRDKAKIAHMFMYRFWDSLYQAHWPLSCVMGTANAAPETVINGSENDRALVRRINEVMPKRIGGTK